MCVDALQDNNVTFQFTSNNIHSFQSDKQYERI